MDLGTLKYQFIRTPLERPLMSLKWALGTMERLKHPELASIHAEEALIQQVVERAVTPTTNCLDVGAHYGTMLSAMLRQSPGGKHTAVEAIPYKVKFLRKRFPEVTLHECALGEEPGSVDFFINVSRSGFSSMAQHGNHTDQFQKIVVECDTLDRRMANCAPVGFMKIDVEGAEEMVLRGAGQFMEEHRPVLLFECGPSGAKAFGTEPVGVFDVLADRLDYDVFFLRDWLDGGAPVTRARFEQALVYPFKAFNWVAQHRSARAS